MCHEFHCKDLNCNPCTSLGQERKIPIIVMTCCVDCTISYHKIICFEQFLKLLYPQVVPPQLGEAVSKARLHNIKFYMEDTATVKTVTLQ